MLRLRTDTPDAWVEAVVANIDAFLADHAANERKVSGSAMRLAVQYPERRPLVDAIDQLDEDFATQRDSAQRGTVNIAPSTSFEYKFIKKNGSNVTWESGANRSYSTPSSPCAVTVSSTWK